jgi:hypothetical protein
MLRRREREEREHEKNRRYNEGYQERYKKLCRFYGRFEFEGLTVVVPEKIEDIIAEGAKLEHCVGGYAVRHCTGQTTILFVRKCEEIDKPYFTVEVGENEQGKYIVQCHGFRNEQGRVKGKFVIWEKPDIIKDFEKEFGSFLKSLKNMLRAEPV